EIQQPLIGNGQGFCFWGFDQLNDLTFQKKPPLPRASGKAPSVAAEHVSTFLLSYERYPQYRSTWRWIACRMKRLEASARSSQAKTQLDSTPSKPHSCNVLKYMSL
ncbi:hypothetical protein, partial [Pokkaliibacter plantistimulans]|uniref:hypothetical protein n=1 Tax=Pokkaliibacter plantistimulans TaxID=1635171 RepID=UPI002D7961B1